MQQILIAENNQVTLRTTAAVFKKVGFDPIPASSPDEARRLAYQKHKDLAAIVLDNRLLNDKDAFDRSGEDLAKELRASGVKLGPIVIYTTFVPGRPHAPVAARPAATQADAGGFPTVWKGDGPKKLVETVNELITLYRRSEPQTRGVARTDEPPVVVYGASARDGAQFRAQLLKKGIRVHLRNDLPGLREAADSLHSALFAVIVEARTHAEGIEAVRLLAEARRTYRRPFYVVAFGAREELKLQASQAGADLPLRKVSPEKAARILTTRLSQLKIRIEEEVGDEAQTQLLVPEYQELSKLLRAATGSRGRKFSAALDIIEFAMGQPFLKPGEKLVLSSLYAQILTAEGGDAAPQTLDICIEGADLLARDRASGAGVREWAERARGHEADFAFGWLDEEFYD